MALDERLRLELERAARPADPSGVYEELIRRRERRRVARKAQHVALAVAVVAGSAGSVLGLSRVFRTGEPGPASPNGESGSLPTGSPSPTPEPSPNDPRITDLGLGVQLCDVTTVDGTFIGDGAQTAYVGVVPGPGGTCPDGEELSGVVAIEISGDEEVDLVSEPFACQFTCGAYAAPDVDGDGTDEVLALNIGFSVSGVALFDVVRDDDLITLVRAMVDPPGDPAMAAQGFDGSGPPQFWIGGDAFTADSLRCEESATGRVLVSVSAEQIPPDSADSVWEVHQTVFELDNGVLRVVDALDHSEPFDRGTPDFARGGECEIAAP